MDEWEHAYYLKYQNRRAENVVNWWNAINWDVVAQRYAAVAGKVQGIYRSESATVKIFSSRAILWPCLVVMWSNPKGRHIVAMPSIH